MENEQLKHAVTQLREKLLAANSMEDQEAQLILQREIINKERRAFDLERQLQNAFAEIQKLRAERDRLVGISSELRAELNKARRSVYEYKRLIEENAAHMGSPNARLSNNPNMDVNMFSEKADYTTSHRVIKEEDNESASQSRSAANTMREA